MIIDVIDFCLKESLSFEDFIFMELIYLNDRSRIKNYLGKFGSINPERLESLVERGFLLNFNSSGEAYLNKIYVTDKFKNHVKSETNENEKSFSSFVGEWMNLFPAGVKSGGYYVKTDPKGCEKKLKKFMTNYPQFTQGIIIQATKNYINELRSKNYEYIKLAPYFIEKDGSSVLAGYCEAALNGEGGKEKKQSERSI